MQKNYARNVSSCRYLIYMEMHATNIGKCKSGALSFVSNNCSPGAYGFALWMTRTKVQRLNDGKNIQVI